MKAYTISLYLFILNIVFSLMVSLQIFGMMSPDPGTPILFGFDQSIIDSASAYQNISITGLEVLDTIGFILMFFQAILNATLLLPVFLGNLGCPAFLQILITTPVWYTYMAAIRQMATGRIMPLFE